MTARALGALASRICVVISGAATACALALVWAKWDAPGAAASPFAELAIRPLLIGSEGLAVLSGIAIASAALAGHATWKRSVLVLAVGLAGAGLFLVQGLFALWSSQGVPVDDGPTFAFLVESAARLLTAAWATALGWSLRGGAFAPIRRMAVVLLLFALVSTLWPPFTFLFWIASLFWWRHLRRAFGRRRLDHIIHHRIGPE